MLKTSKEFDFVYKNSYKFRSEVLDICVLRANMAGQFYEKFRRLPCNFVGFSVSKKVGNAVERNLIKRRLRAICRDFFGAGNSVLGMQFRTCEKNLDSAKSQNLNENNPRVSANLESRPLRGAKNRNQASSSASADFLLEAKKRGSPPKSEKRQLLARRGSGAGGAALLRKEIRELNSQKSYSFAESSLDSVDSAILSQNGLQCRFCESARNDNIAQNLICIFIAKSQILQTPFIALKNNIFATLKRQLNFRQGSYKKPRTISPHSAQNRTSQNHTKGTL